MSQSESRPKVLILVPVFNEETKIGNVLHDISQQPFDGFDSEVLVIDDCSDDNTSEVINEYDVHVIRNEKRKGVGYIIKKGIRYGRHNGFNIIVLCAGNGKMPPAQIGRVVAPIIEGNVDYVQGSRYLDNAGSLNNLPQFRNIMIRLFSFFVSCVFFKKITDITCGFRAYKLSLFDDERFNIEQEWLDKYEFEYYLHYYVLKLRYDYKEVPVSMMYPPNKKNYSKIRPFIGWWSMVRPWIFLILRVKK